MKNLNTIFKKTSLFLVVFQFLLTTQAQTTVDSIVFNPPQLCGVGSTLQAYAYINGIPDTIPGFYWFSSNDSIATVNPQTGLVTYITPGNVEITYEYYTPAVRDTFGGGIVIYIYRQGDLGYVAGETHGLICAPIDQGRYPWGHSNQNISTSNAVGSGLQNTINIINAPNNTTNAATICYQLELYGYSDWFLPSRSELQAIYENLKVFGIGNFQNTFYWSSSNAGEIYSYLYSLSTNSYTNDYKYNITFVRAVRAF